MNRQTLWTSKYNLPPTLSWALAVLGLAVLIFVLFTIPAYGELATNPNEKNPSLKEHFPLTPVWRWLVIIAYLLVVFSVLFSPILVAWPADIRQESLSGLGQAASAGNRLEEQHLRRQSLISTMAGGTIHEIRGPLTAARGFVQLIGTLSPEDALTKEYSEYAILEIDRIEQLLQEYMLLSKAVAPKSQPVNLLDAAHNVCNMMEAVMAERHIRLRFDGSQPACILGDPFYLQQVLQHLLFNAAEATPPRGHVSVELRSNDNEVSLTVSDTGVGMDQNALDHCFDPFFSTKESGTGLGLAICQRMVTDMQGRIEASSRPQAGTTFTLTFPLYLGDCDVED